MSSWAELEQVADFTDPANPDWLLFALDVVIIVASVWVAIEAVLAMRRAARGPEEIDELDEQLAASGRAGQWGAHGCARSGGGWAGSLAPAVLACRSSTWAPTGRHCGRPSVRRTTSSPSSSWARPSGSPIRRPITRPS